jgi:hypothetical protein
MPYSAANPVVNGTLDRVNDMDLIARRFPGLLLTLGMVVERMWFPLAVIVGLAGGALIGTEIMQMQMPQVPTIH